VQRRVQRYGWDKAVAVYEQCWRRQLEPAHDLMLDMIPLSPGDRVLDVACGTGLVSLRVAAAVGSAGEVVGVDISDQMVEAARRTATLRDVGNARFLRGGAEQLLFADQTFDAAVCGLGLMYLPDPVDALREMRRLLRPGGSAAAAVWGTRQECGWAEIFPITDARVASDVCPLFFHLGTKGVLARSFEAAGFGEIRLQRLSTTLCYENAEDALAAAFQGGPVALAYSRFDAATRQAVHAEYLDSIACYKVGDGYRVPGEFVVVAGRVPFAEDDAYPSPKIKYPTTNNGDVR
jgi:ubiquinone/menaquinone biosynthesis C-methylase UbiE